MKIIRLFLFIFLICFVISCTNNPTNKEDENQTPANIEITGTWSINNINVVDGGAGAEDATMVITNTTNTVTFSVTGTNNENILEYDNLGDWFVGKIIANPNPAYVGKYKKSTWQFTDSTHIKVSSYEVKDTQAEAKASSTVTWGPTDNWTKQ